MSGYEKLSNLSDAETLRAAATDIESVEGTGIAAAVMVHKLRRIADHLERYEASLRASTELLREYNDIDWAKDDELTNQIAANEAAMEGK